MLNVNRLRVLIEVAHRGSFSAAADALSYTQSAVSQQIAALEAETGVNLIERLPRGVRLTPAGRVLLEHAEGIVARLHAAEAELAAIAGLRGGQLRMASFPTAGATLMPLAIAIFRGQHPEVSISLAEGEPEEIGPRLSAGEFDIALLFEFDGTSESLGPDFTREPLLEDPMFLALPADHALADPLELEQQREVELARSQARRDLVGLALGERDLDPGVGTAERGDRLGHQGGARGREGGRAQVAAAARGDCRDFVLGGLQLGEDAADVPGQRGARGGRADAAAGPLDQRRPCFSLKRLDRLRDRRLRVVERVGGGREGALGDDLAKDVQALHIKHKQYLF